ncbi:MULTISPECIES: hypothetical protein [unclassified Streptomyces]|uniref:hypothetical protein n=1 Tax=unclassified Streptomyces TaxID=2593676 RepID=UPI002259FB9D|nr:MULTISPECIES: hypothetical protein [unclassified Streptomyces]MCX4408021.1 hypothetical protein [Streptomyces sp. NBC_01764]MCX5187253.1 hypothetical protein [Streptomyces sp. NBC_00268]
MRREISERIPPPVRLGIREMIRRTSELSSSGETFMSIHGKIFGPNPLRREVRRFRVENFSRTALSIKLRLAISTGQGPFNLGMAVACCVMALSEPLRNVDKWFPLIFSDHRGRLDGLAGQLSDGSLILSITTIFVTVTTLVRYITQARIIFKNKESAASLWGKMRQQNLTNAQGGVFLSALTIMWLLQGRGVEDVWMAVLSYAFAFFVDDWTIISEYSIKLDVPSLALHKWRLRLAYVCLLTPSLALAWDEFGRWGVIIMAWYTMSLIAVSIAHRRASEKIIWPKREIPQQQSEEASVSSGDDSYQA